MSLATCLECHALTTLCVLQGLLKTKKQKEQEAAAARRAEMLRAQGLAPSTSSGGDEKKKKPIYGDEALAPYPVS